MRVEFWKVNEKGRLACGWDAHIGKRTHVPGAFMPSGRGLPHDLAQYVIEAGTGCQHGFWGLISAGATFKSTGRRRTKEGRALIRAHHDGLIEAEHQAAEQGAAWAAGEKSPVTAALDRALAQWHALVPGERLVFEWPSLTGVVTTSGASTTGRLEQGALAIYSREQR